MRLSYSRVRARIVENNATENPIAGKTKTRIKENPNSAENSTTVERRSTWQFIVGRKRKKKNMT